MSQPLPKFIPHEPIQFDPVPEFEPAPEIPPSRRERLRDRAQREYFAWKTDLSDWSREKEWLSEFWANRKQDLHWLARGTYQIWGFVAIAFWERVSRADIEVLKHETNVAGKTAPSTFALVVGAGVTLWITVHLEAWGWPLMGVGFLVLQAVRILLYLGSPMKVVEPAPQTRRRRSNPEEELEEDHGWEREEL